MTFTSLVRLSSHLVWPVPWSISSVLPLFPWYPFIMPFLIRVALTTLFVIAVFFVPMLQGLSPWVLPTVDLWRPWVLVTSSFVTLLVAVRLLLPCGVAFMLQVRPSIFYLLVPSLSMPCLACFLRVVSQRFFILLTMRGSLALLLRLLWPTAFPFCGWILFLLSPLISLLLFLLRLVFCLLWSLHLLLFLVFGRTQFSGIGALVISVWKCWYITLVL